jgi:peroxiredoxin
VSPDRPAKLRETLVDQDLAYTLLSDSSARAARAMGIAWKLSALDFTRLRGFGIDVEEASGETHRLLPVPSVFLVDREGVIRFRYSNPDYTVRLENDRLVEAARSLAPGA